MWIIACTLHISTRDYNGTMPIAPACILHQYISKDPVLVNRFLSDHGDYIVVVFMVLSRPTNNHWVLSDILGL